VTATTSELDPRWQAAVTEFNAGHYHEAHELWESLWDDADGEAKVLCRALLTIAAGYAKLDVGEVNGARKLLERGLASLQQGGPGGAALGALPASVAEGLSRLRQVPFGERAGLDSVPRPRL